MLAVEVAAGSALAITGAFRTVWPPSVAVRAGAAPRLAAGAARWPVPVAAGRAAAGARAARTAARAPGSAGASATPGAVAVTAAAVPGGPAGSPSGAASSPSPPAARASATAATARTPAPVTRVAALRRAVVSGHCHRPPERFIHTKIRGPLPGTGGGPLMVRGGVLLSHEASLAVPSALKGLTSGFGMGPGVSPSLWPPGTVWNCAAGGAGRVPGTAQWTHSKSKMCVVPSPRPVSTGQLHPLRGFHFRPINPVVWLGALPTRWWWQASS
jgi:hypothetical protein